MSGGAIIIIAIGILCLIILLGIASSALDGDRSPFHA